MTGFASGFTYLCIILFELYCVGFGQGNRLFQSQRASWHRARAYLLHLRRQFLRCRRPAAQLPTFWYRWMYWLTPFHYLLRPSSALPFTISP